MPPSRERWLCLPTLLGALLAARGAAALPAAVLAKGARAVSPHAPAPASPAAAPAQEDALDTDDSDDDLDSAAEVRRQSEELRAAKEAEARALADEERLRRERALSRAALGAGNPLRARLEDSLGPEAPDAASEGRLSQVIAREIERFATFDAGQVARRYDIPVELNDEVSAYLRLFQGPLRSHFVLWLARANRYAPRMREILTHEGLPVDTVYLALIESGFNTLAYSPARARGQWQFIASTGRRFGLRSDFWLDERRDPEKATLAAARYLKELRAQLGSWYLAWAGYNAGPGKIRKAIRRSHTDDFWTLAHGRVLRAETKGYVPKLIAAALIAKHPLAFGFDDVLDEPQLSYEEVPVERPTNLEVVASAAGVEVATLRELNPALRRFCTPPALDGRPYSLRVPVGTGAQVRAALAALPPGGTLAFKYHLARRGETLASVGREFGVAPEVVARMNGLHRDALPPGRELVIPVAGSLATDARVVRVGDEREVGRRRWRWRHGRRQPLSTGWIASDDGQDPWHGAPPPEPPAAPPSPHLAAAPQAKPDRAARPRVAKVPVEPPPADAVRYQVAEGDSLWSIAKGHGASIEELARWNRIARPARHKLFPGERLWVRATAAKPVAAAAEPAAPVSVHHGISYQVRDGDNLWGISRHFGVTVADLLRWNQLDEDRVLRPGATLKLEVAGR